MARVSLALVVVGSGLMILVSVLNIIQIGFSGRLSTGHLLWLVAWSLMAVGTLFSPISLYWEDKVIRFPALVRLMVPILLLIAFSFSFIASLLRSLGE